MTDPVRFPAQLPYEKWRAVSNVFGLMLLGKWGEVQQAYETQKGAVDDSIGAGNYWWSQFGGGDVTVSVPKGYEVPLGQFQTGPWISLAPRTGVATQVAADANISAVLGSTSGTMYGYVSDTKPDKVSNAMAQTGGNGITRPIAIKAGQWFTWWHEYSGPTDSRASTQ